MAKPKQIIRPEDITTCESTQQMIAKARRDGVELFFDRAEAVKPCPIGASSACCKHCSMGPCRISPSDPYKHVGVCGATIDTIILSHDIQPSETLNALPGADIDIPFKVARAMVSRWSMPREKLRTGSRCRAANPTSCKAW